MYHLWHSHTSTSSQISCVLSLLIHSFLRFLKQGSHFISLSFVSRCGLSLVIYSFLLREFFFSIIFFFFFFFFLITLSLPSLSGTGFPLTPKKSCLLSLSGSYRDSPYFPWPLFHYGLICSHPSFAHLLKFPRASMLYSSHLKLPESLFRKLF